MSNHLISPLIFSRAMNRFDIYRSSAGSGKTFTLVLNYLSIALASDYAANYTRILAITFTNKAAAEMKERIVQYLEMLCGRGDHKPNPSLVSMLKENTQLDEEELAKRANQMLKHILHRYSEFGVSTIDSFVHKLIRAHSRDLQLHPDFVIELDTVAFLEETVDQIISEAGRDKEIGSLLKSYALDQLNEEKNWNFRDNLLAVARVLLNEDSEPYLRHLQDWSPSDFILLKKKIRTRLKTTEDSIRPLAQQALTIIGDQSNYIHFSRAGIPNWLKALKTEPLFLPAKSYITSIEDDALIPKSAKPDRRAFLEGIIDELSPILRKILELLNEQLPAYILQKLILSNHTALSLLNTISERMIITSNERNLLLINRFNSLISEVVRDNPAPFIYERLGERYHHILIDEFQDTSVMQWNNFLPLIQNALSAGGYSMVVGDGKQAIYRFRNGDVAQFERLPKVEMTDELSAEYNSVLSRYGEVKNLDSNYRSKSEIIAFNNLFFDALASELGDNQSIYTDVTQKEIKGEGGYVLVEKVAAKNAEDEQAQEVARTSTQVNTLIEEGWQPHDIAILCRKSKSTTRIAQQLMSDGHKVVSSDSLLFDKHHGVHFMVQILAHLRAPEDATEATKLVQACIELHPDLERSSTWSELRPFRKNGPDLVQKLFKLAQWPAPKREWVSVTLSVLVERIWQHYPHLASNDLFIQAFLDLCQQKTLRQGMDLRSFLAWWERKKDFLSIDLATTQGAIQIMTIHKSKGLQFPVVIIPNFGWSDKKGGKHWTQLKGEADTMPVALLPHNKLLEQTDYAHLLETENRQALLDHVNLLYVACTRAETRLYMSCYETSRGNPELKLALAAMERAFGENWKEDKKLEIGKMSPPKEGNAIPSAPILPTKSTETPLADSMRYSFRHERQEENSERLKSRQRGTALHEALSCVRDYTHWEEDLARWLADNKTETTEADYYRSVLKTFFDLPKGRSLFAPNQDAKNEWELLNAQGESLRPDRVIFEEDRIHVIDFKTGDKNKSHHKQVKKYEDLISAIFEKPTAGTLIYLDTQQIDFVSVER